MHKLAYNSRSQNLRLSRGDVSLKLINDSRVIAWLWWLIPVWMNGHFCTSGFTCVCMCVLTQKSFLLLRGNKIKIWQLSLWLVFSPSCNSPVEQFGW